VTVNGTAARASADAIEITGLPRDNFEVPRDHEGRIRATGVLAHNHGEGDMVARAGHEKDLPKRRNISR
jgi:hypothetical protein